ncbi:MAG: HD domain-containing protein [Patescibacteria group bacterium]|nr:HD domain-containing protein [Patescibacteria group bacterium]
MPKFTAAQKNIIRFLHEAEKLKSVLRHSWLSSGRRESTAEHTWRMALMAMLLHPYLKRKPDLFKTLKMVLVHDLVEVYAGDMAIWKRVRSAKLTATKQAQELAAIGRLAKTLGGKQGRELKKIWLEFEARKSPEALFAQALDRLEVKIQHQEADVKYLTKAELRYNLVGGQKETAYDPFLAEFWLGLRDNWLLIYKKHRVSKKLYS